MAKGLGTGGRGPDRSRSAALVWSPTRAQRPDPSPNPSPGRRGERPEFSLERLLQRGGGSDGVSGAGKDREEAVAFTPAFDEDAVLLLDAANEQGIMTRDAGAHDTGVLFPEAGAALDGGEEESHCAGWQVRHRPVLGKQEGRFAGAGEAGRA